MQYGPEGFELLICNCSLAKFLTLFWLHFAPDSGSPSYLFCWPSSSFWPASCGKACGIIRRHMASESISWPSTAGWTFSNLVPTAFWTTFYSSTVCWITKNHAWAGYAVAVLARPGNNDILRNISYKISDVFIMILIITGPLFTSRQDWARHADPKAVDGFGRWWPQVPIQLGTSSDSWLGIRGWTSKFTNWCFMSEFQNF